MLPLRWSGMPPLKVRRCMGRALYRRSGVAAILAGNVGFRVSLRIGDGLTGKRKPAGRENFVVTANIREHSAVDSRSLASYLQLIPIHRFPAAHSCARRFFAWSGAFLATRWGGWRPVELKEG